MAANCSSCNSGVILGRQRINQHAAPLPGPPPANRRRVTYNLGHGNYATNEEVAKKELLERDFSNIAEFETVQQSEFWNGMLGATFLPPVLISKIPKIVDPDDYLHFHSIKYSGICAAEHIKVLKKDG